MQYAISLPADYDMGVIRRRVAERGPGFDGFPGLRFKAFLVRERAEGAPTNEYAPFYVWDDIAGMRRFLWGGGGYGGIVASFGRPQVADWTVADVLHGDGDAGSARWASRTVTSLPEGVVPEVAVPAAVEEARRTAGDTVLTVVAVDVTTWTVCRFALHRNRPQGTDEAVHRVLHLSTGAGVGDDLAAPPPLPVPD
jgi:hypothetical protein